MRAVALVRAPGSGRDSAGRVRRALHVGALVSLPFLLLVLLVHRLDAVVALGLAVLIVGGLAMLVRPELATLATVFLLYINFPAILTKQHGLPHVVAGSFILLLAFPLLHFLILRRKPLRADATFFLMLLLGGVYLLSTFLARDSGVALRAVQEYAIEGLLLYWLVFNVIRSLDTLRRVIWTVLVAGALLSGLSLYQTATRSFGQEFGGLAYRNYELIQDGPERDGPARRRSWDRAGGPLDEPNRFAQILIVLVPLSLAVLRGAPTAAARVSAAACALLLVGGVLVTLSRGGFLTLLVLTAMMVAARWLRASRVLACGVLLALAAPSVPFFADRMSATGQALGLIEADASAAPRELDSAALIRVSVMQAAIHVFLDHPLIGVGPGQFAPFYSQPYSRSAHVGSRDLPPGAWRAHSLYLEIAAETGVVGLSIFLGIVAILLRRLWLLRRHWLTRDPGLSDLAMAFALSIVAYQVSGIFLHLSYQPYYWLLLALAGVAVHLMTAEQRTGALPADALLRGALPAGATEEERTWRP